uniref:FAS1 domain-containing protein n=1 Tax=Macrostomum lignano TaxID=282301 RepID=A0A1I8FEH7_9PLAT
VFVCRLMRCSWPSNTAVTYLSALYLSFLSLLYGACQKRHNSCSGPAAAGSLLCCLIRLALCRCSKCSANYSTFTPDSGGRRKWLARMNTDGKLAAPSAASWCRPQQHRALDDAYKADSVGFNALDKTKLVQHHYIAAAFGGSKAFLSDWASQGTPVGEDIGFGQVIILRPQEGTLYLGASRRAATWSYRVNNAAVVVADSNKEAMPGRRDTTYSYVYSALRGRQSLSRCATIFLPSDAAWDRIPSAEMEKLNSLADEFPQVLVAHFAAEHHRVHHLDEPQQQHQVFHRILTPWAWYNDSRMYLNSASKAFVSGWRRGRPVSWTNPSTTRSGNAIIHVVDRVLGLFAHEDLLSLAQTNAPEFYRACSGSFKPSMKEFRPADWQKAAPARSRFRMYNNESRPPAKRAVFVRAELTMFDQPAKNGIFHKVIFPRVLGQPVADDGLTPCSRPANAAMAASRGYKNSKEVFRRMVLPNQKIIADVAQPGSLSYATANTAENEKITVNLKGSAGLHYSIRERSQARSSWPTSAWRQASTSGTKRMVYPSSQVLFRDNDVEGYTSARARRRQQQLGRCWLVSLAALLTARWADARY